jgi:REP element-mobilizing transposase RayT
MHFFGEIIDDKFFPSKIGEIAETHWKEIPDHFHHATLGAFVIMPNHMHGIINIRGSLHESLDIEIKTIDLPVVETRFIASPNPENHQDNISNSHRGGITRIHNPMLHQNLSRMIRWYTGRVSYEAHKMNPDFNWQRRFDDRIIRDSKEYEIKTRYIQNNIMNWKEDEFY